MHILFTCIVHTNDSETEYLSKLALGIMFLTLSVLLTYAVFSIIQALYYLYKWYKTGKFRGNDSEIKDKQNEITIYPMNLSY